MAAVTTNALFVVYFRIFLIHDRDGIHWTSLMTRPAKGTSLLNYCLLIYDLYLAEGTGGLAFLAAGTFLYMNADSHGMPLRNRITTEST